MKNNVKKFDCYGEGWLFIGRGNKINNINNINLSKFNFGKGYTLSAQGFGVIDPLFGDAESDNAWIVDTDFIVYVLENTEKSTKFIEKIATLLDKELNVDISDNLKDIVDICVKTDPITYIMEIFEDLKLAQNYAICGITDEDYFQKLLQERGYINDDNFEIVYLGD